MENIMTSSNIVNNTIYPLVPLTIAMQACSLNETSETDKKIIESATVLESYIPPDLISLTTQYLDWKAGLNITAVRPYKTLNPLNEDCPIAYVNFNDLAENYLFAEKT